MIADAQVSWAAGLIHASIVMAEVRSRELESLTVTQLPTPSKDSALPKMPFVQAAPRIVPALPPPEASATDDPVPSLNPYAATRPDALVTGRMTVTVLPAEGDSTLPLSSAARALTVYCPAAPGVQV